MMTRTTLLTFLMASIGWVAGCGGPHVGVEFQTSDQRDQRTVEVENDPVAYLRSVAEACSAQPAYEVEFHRQERAGLFVKSLKEEEHSRVKFQADPLRIRMDMLDEDSEFIAVAYIAGMYDDKLRCRWRKGTFGGAGSVSDYDPNFAVKFGRSQSPITEFGVARLLERIVSTFDEMSDRGLAPDVAYVGLTQLEDTGRHVHHIRLTYDPATDLRRTIVDLLVDPDTTLPAACYLRLPNGDLDAKYVYLDFEPRASIPLDEFVIDK